MAGANFRKVNPDVGVYSRDGILLPDLCKYNFKGAILTRADLSNTKLANGNLEEANLINADIGDADLSNANFKGAKLNRANLSRSNLSGANLNQATLIGTILEKTKLVEANLNNAYINGANFRQTNLRSANFTEAYICKSDFHSASFDETDFSHAYVVDVSFTNIDLSLILGLETTKYYGPSSVGIDTIYRSRGVIPYVFLRGCGVPENLIQYIRNIVNHPIQFYSCFISYSSKDKDFAERLYADLQSNSVRCWFAPEDLKTGDKTRQIVDDSIRIHDKLLLVLSKQSINSKWVEKEVETAFERETPKKTVLFPVRLDDAVKETDQAWAADIRKTRHIGDFRNWKDNNAYKKAFERLLRDLKA